MESPKYFSQEELHALRKSIDACQQMITTDKQTHEQPQPRNYELYSQAQFLADVKLKEAKMWVGKMLEGLGSELPKEFQDKAEGSQASGQTDTNETTAA